MLRSSLLGRLSAVAGGMVCLLVLAIGVGCAPPRPSVHPVVKKAVFDLDCPRKQIRYHEIDDDTIGVTGCGRRTKYLKLCRSQTDTNCRWIEN